MKVLIAVVMFLFGLFVGILVIPTFREFSSPLYAEEEYSTPRIKTILNGFGVVLPLEASDINLFLKQNESKKQVWVKFVCPADAKEDFIQQLTAKHSGMLNREVEQPKMFDGTVITWWTFLTSYRYYEFNGMCVAYDEVLHNLYLYAVSGDAISASQAPVSD